MKTYKEIFVLAFVLAAASAFAQTSPLPPQVQGPTSGWSEPSGSSLISTWRMANSGTIGTSNNMGLSYEYVPSSTVYYQSGVATWNSLLAGSGSFLGTYTTSQPADARCATYGTIFGGTFYDTTDSIAYPTWWSGTSYTEVKDGSHPYPGAFWDVNHDPSSGIDSFCGYYFDGTNNQGCYWNSGRGPNNPFLLTGSLGSYDGSECRGLDAADDLCGQLFSASLGNPPAFWHYTSGTSWTLVDVSTSSYWIAGRNGYLVGITDRDFSGNV